MARVSDACQINDFDHTISDYPRQHPVSDACQINDFDHFGRLVLLWFKFQMPVRSMTLTTHRPVRIQQDRFQMPVRSMTLTTPAFRADIHAQFQMPVRSMTLTTISAYVLVALLFQMPVRSMTLTTTAAEKEKHLRVSDACQINDFDHSTIICMSSTLCFRCLSDQ